MRITLAVTLTVALSAPSALAQKNMPNAVQGVKTDGIAARYLNFRWSPEAFAAMETGGSHPAAGRSWVLSVVDPRQSFQWQGQKIPENCGCLLILNPATKASPMTLEIRRVDFGPLFVNLNVIATPPEGETLHKAPADFKKVSTTADRLDVDLKPDGKKVLLSVHYGDRLATIELTR